MSMNVSEILGKRVLAILGSSSYSRTVQECKILEVSPSGNWVKVMNIDGRKFWYSIQNVQRVEVLIDLTAGKPPDTKS